MKTYKNRWKSLKNTNFITKRIKIIENQWKTQISLRNVSKSMKIYEKHKFPYENVSKSMKINEQHKFPYEIVSKSMKIHKHLNFPTKTYQNQWKSIKNINSMSAHFPKPWHFNIQANFPTKASCVCMLSSNPPSPCKTKSSCMPALARPPPLPMQDTLHEIKKKQSLAVSISVHVAVLADWLRASACSCSSQRTCVLCACLICSQRHAPWSRARRVRSW